MGNSLYRSACVSTLIPGHPMSLSRCLFLLPFLSLLHADENALIRLLVEKGTLKPEEGEALLAPPRIAPANPWLDALQVRGRVQTQAGVVQAENDSSDGSYSTIELRRAFIGLQGNYDNDVFVLLEANVVPGEMATTNAFIQWKKHPEARIKVGFDKPFTAIEEVGSSSTLITMERSLITNTVAAPGEMTGVMLEGSVSPFYYGLGLFTGEDNRNTDNANPDYLSNALFGIDFDDLLAEKSKLKLQSSYLVGEDPESKFSYDSLVTSSLSFQGRAFECLVEHFHADNEGEITDGFYIMPSYTFSPRLQGVFRYEQSESDNEAGLRAASRYARRVDFLEDPTLQRGDEHHSFYVGLNIYLNGHGNKLMFAVEVSELEGTPDGSLESVTTFSAWRTLF